MTHGKLTLLLRVRRAGLSLALAPGALQWHPLAALTGAPVDLSRTKMGVLARVQQCAGNWMRVAMWCFVYVLHRLAMGTAQLRRLGPALPIPIAIASAIIGLL